MYLFYSSLPWILSALYFGAARVNEGLTVNHNETLVRDARRK